MEATTYQVNVKALRMATAFASRDDTRPGLLGVTLKGDRVMASDGHVAAIIAAAVEAPDTAPEVSIPTSAIRPLKGDGNGTVEANGEWRLASQDASVRFTPYETTFPNIDQVVPKTDPKFTFSVNPALAADVFKALAAYLGAKRGYPASADTVVTLEFRDPMGAMVIRAGAGDHVTCLLMPCRR